MTDVRSYLKPTTDPAPKKRKRLLTRSTKAVDRQPERDACVEAVWERAGGRCEYAALIPEVECGSYVTELRPKALEVDEIRGGAYRCTEQYDPERCRLSCHNHHDWKTANKRAVLERLLLS